MKFKVGYNLRCAAVVSFIGFALTLCGCDSTRAPPTSSSSATSSQLSGGGGISDLITAPSNAPIVDSSGNVWTMVNNGGGFGNRIAENGVVDGATQLVTLILYYQGNLYQENVSSIWFRSDGVPSGWIEIGGDPRSNSPLTPSANGTIIPSASEIVDALGNAWVLVDTGGSFGNQIAENGVIDPITQNVSQLLFYQEAIYEKNTSNNWFKSNGIVSSWTQVAGDPRIASASGTVISTALSQFTDASGNIWSLINNGGAFGVQIAENGVIDSTTENVAEMLYYKGGVYQENASNNWYKSEGVSGSWIELTGDPRITSASGTVISSAFSEFTDASGNVWSLVNSGGTLQMQITENSAIDPITQQVTQMLYYNGAVYQENSLNNWYESNGTTSSWTAVSGDPRL